MTAKLFTPIQLGGITLPNRIVVSPMCQYSADDGSMTDWHHVHLGTFACSGAGLFVVEKTGVTREGRITHGCTGLYSDENEAAMARAVQVYRGITKNPIGVQIGHAGRKASSAPPWQGGKALAAHESPWPTVAPSAIPFGEGWHVPHELSTREDLDLELAARHVGDGPRKKLPTAIDGVESLREARRQPPLDGRLLLRDRRRRQAARRGRAGRQPRLPDERSAVHVLLPSPVKPAA